jgi:hypothetical protein
MYFWFSNACNMSHPSHLPLLNWTKSMWWRLEIIQHFLTLFPSYSSHFFS